MIISDEKNEFTYQLGSLDHWTEGSDRIKQHWQELARLSSHHSSIAVGLAMMSAVLCTCCRFSFSIHWLAVHCSKQEAFNYAGEVESDT